MGKDMPCDLEKPPPNPIIGCYRYIPFYAKLVEKMIGEQKYNKKKQRYVSFQEREADINKRSNPIKFQTGQGCC